VKLLHQGNHALTLSFRKNLDFPTHLQNAIELVVLTSGHTTALCGGQRFSVSAGDVLVVFPNQAHGFENSTAECYVMIIPMNPYLSAYHSILDQKVPTDPVLRKGLWEHTNLLPLLEIACREWKTVSSNVRQGYILVIVDKLLSLLSLTDVPPVNADVLQSILLYLNAHYKEPLTRQEIARAVGYNESYISHIFSQTLRTTLTDYLTSLRLSDALNLLCGTNLTVSQVALYLGFGSIRSFNRAFLRKMGISPTAYRASFKNLTR